MNDSAPTEPAFLGPTLPVYPPLEQVCRVFAPALPATNVYPAFVQQYAGGLTFRDREPCYVWEPNGIVLGNARYDCRLVMSYLGLPLFAAVCCPTSGGFGSSASS